MQHLPATIAVADFDRLHDDLPAWRELIESLAAEHGSGPVVQMESGTVLVALLGSQRVLKLYPPFLRDHFEFERAMLQHLAGPLSVPTPQLLASGERDGWPWLLMTQLQGQVLTEVWPAMREAEKCRLLHALGALCAQVHALPVDGMAQHAPLWTDFIARQRAACHGRQQRTGLPPHLLAQVDEFVAGPLPAGPDVLLTGEYTPMNLLVSSTQPAGTLTGMFDFGDGLVGPREYDWLGPLCFLCAGQEARCTAFFSGYGVMPDFSQRLALMRLLLLHRYSSLRAQLAWPGWQQAPNFEALTALVWPC